MAKRWAPLGELEATVMNVVWRHENVTAREVCDRLTGRKERAYTTVMTTLERLHRKGLLLREKDGMAWRYVPAVTREAFENQLTSALAAEILSEHGEVALSAFVDAAAEIDEAHLERLSRLIAERRRRNK